MVRRFDIVDVSIGTEPERNPVKVPRAVEPRDVGEDLSQRRDNWKDVDRHLPAPVDVQLEHPQGSLGPPCPNARPLHALHLRAVEPLELAPQRRESRELLPPRDAYVRGLHEVLPLQKARDSKEDLEGEAQEASRDRKSVV